MSQTVLFNMRIDRELKARLDEAATRDHRSTASLLNVVLSSWIEGRDYQPSFNQAAIKPPSGRETLRRAPGRPRHSKRPRVHTGNLKPAALPFLEGRERVTIDQIIEGTAIDDQPGIRIVLRELLIELGWTEYQDTHENRVWIAPNS